MIYYTIAMPEQIEILDREKELSSKYGLVIIKPDAIEEDIFEYIINFLATNLHDYYGVEFTGIFPIQITAEDMQALYPKKSPDLLAKFGDYLTSTESLILCFRGDGSQNLWQILSRLKGVSIKDRPMEALESGESLGIEQGGVRGLIPLPDKKEAYRAIFDKIIESGGDNFMLEMDLFNLYMRNLVHTPDDLDDFSALLNLLTKEQVELSFGSDNELNHLLK